MSKCRSYKRASFLLTSLFPPPLRPSVLPRSLATSQRDRTAYQPTRLFSHEQCCPFPTHKRARRATARLTPRSPSPDRLHPTPDTGRRWHRVPTLPIWAMGRLRPDGDDQGGSRCVHPWLVPVSGCALVFSRRGFVSLCCLEYRWALSMVTIGALAGVHGAKTDYRWQDGRHAVLSPG